jgi:outer membrane biosynthesis protein TonB
VGLGSSLRFAIEAALLIGIGVALAAADVGLLPFVLFMAGAWVLVATAERMFSRPDVPVPYAWKRTSDEVPESPPMHRPSAPEPVRREPDPDPEPQESQQLRLEAVPEPEPDAAAEPEPEPEEEEEKEEERQVEAPAEPVIELPQAAHRRPNGWNLWDLELRAKQLAGEDPARDEEWHALFVSLRDFAQPDGTLPAEFDRLVHESFGVLISRRP